MTWWNENNPRATSIYLLYKLLLHFIHFNYITSLKKWLDEFFGSMDTIFNDEREKKLS